MIKTECESENEKVKTFSKELNYYLDILSKFTDWINDKAQIEKDDVSAAANDYLKTLASVVPRLPTSKAKFRLENILPTGTPIPKVIPISDID